MGAEARPTSEGAEHRRTKSSRDVLRLQTCRARRELSGDVRTAAGVQLTAENGPRNIWRPLSVPQGDCPSLGLTAPHYELRFLRKPGTTDAIGGDGATAFLAWLRALEATAGRHALPVALERALSLVQLLYLFWAYAKRRPAQGRSHHPVRDRAVGMCGTVMLFLFDWSAPTTRFAPVLRPLTTAAVAVRVGCVLSLGRSFGIAAANRGVVTTGAYRYVRHPMYAAYVLSTMLQLCLHPSFRNSLVVGCSCSFHAWRIRCEEQLLGQSSTYRAYCARVRWRMLPGVA